MPARMRLLALSCLAALAAVPAAAQLVETNQIGLRMGQALAAVFDEFDALRDVDEGEDAIAVDRRAAGSDAF